MSPHDQPTTPPPPQPPPPPVASTPSWHVAVVAVLRSLLALWFLLLAWLSAFFGMLSDGCGEPCPAFERQILIGMGVVVVALVALFIATTRIDRRLGSLVGRIALFAAAAVAGPVVLLLVGGVLSSLAP